MSSIIIIISPLLILSNIIIIISFLLSNSLIHCDECIENLPRAEVDEIWFLKTSRSIPNGWFVMMDPVSDSEISGVLSNSKSMPSEGSNNLCMTVYPRDDGGGVTSLVDKLGLKCIYDTINLQYCEIDGDNPLLATLPKNVKIEIVKSDGQNYVALVACIAGTLQKWFVLTPTQEPLPDDTIYEIMSYFEEIGVTNNTESDGHSVERMSFGGECTNNDGVLSAISSIFG